MILYLAYLVSHKTNLFITIDSNAVFDFRITDLPFLTNNEVLIYGFKESKGVLKIYMRSCCLQ